MDERKPLNSKVDLTKLESDVSGPKGDEPVKDVFKNESFQLYNADGGMRVSLLLDGKEVPLDESAATHLMVILKYNLKQEV